MKRIGIVGLFLFAWLTVVRSEPSVESAAAPARSVCVLTMHEDITHNTLYLVRRAAAQAEQVKAAAFVIDMNTNGGRVDVTEEIMQLLQHLSMPTYTFVEQRAYSAGAFIAAATKSIYMAPGSVIGAATPVMLIPGGSGPAELPKSYEEKITSALRALIRATAQENGHRPDVFEAMVDADLEVTIDGKIISPKGKLLTLTAEEAMRKYGDPPQPLLAAGSAASLADLLGHLGLGNAPIVRVEPYGVEVLARWITLISPLLITIGVVAIYIEMQSPGIGTPALVAVIAFAIYFLGFFVAGLAGWEPIILFAVGFTLLAIEVFVIPGFGMTGAAGILLILVSLVWAATPIMPSEGFTLPTWEHLQTPVRNVAIGFAGAAVVAVLLARYLPQTTLFRKMELSTTTSAAAGYVSGPRDGARWQGATGLAETNLRPAGKARFGDELVDVVTEGDHIERGASVTVIEAGASRVVVKRTV